MTWHRPARFQRVCPLLVETKEGLRCSANTPDVRPFWGRAFGYYGGALLVVYATAALSVFIFLRTIGYPVSIVHVSLPPLWHKVGQARSWFFVERSNRAFAEGRSTEGLLYLKNAYEFDPTNYVAGLALAKNLQAGQPAHSDDVFQRLLRDHPDKRHGTAQEWFRALLARGNFEKIIPLAQEEVVADPAHAHAWMRGLLFATRRMASDQPLRDLLANPAPRAATWHRLLETELLVRAGRKNEARAAIERPWPANSHPFTVYYRVNTLIEQHEPMAAVDLLGKHAHLLDEEARLTLFLAAFGEASTTNVLHRQAEALLASPLNLRTIKILCAQLIRYPDGVIFGRLLEKMEREPLPLNTETAGAWFSVLCTAGAVGDKARLHELTARLRGASKTPFVALGLIEAFFRGETAERQVTSFLPLLPLPTEINYALIERYTPATPVPIKRS